MKISKKQKKLKPKDIVFLALNNDEYIGFVTKQRQLEVDGSYLNLDKESLNSTFDTWERVPPSKVVQYLEIAREAITEVFDLQDRLTHADKVNLFNVKLMKSKENNIRSAENALHEKDINIQFLKDWIRDLERLL